MMKQILLSITLLLFCILPLHAVGDGDNDIPKYDLACAGTGIEGTYLATVSVYLPKANVKTDDALRKATVHGVIFKGISGEQGCTPQRPLTNSPAIEQEQAAFFSEFFKEGGSYLQYTAVIEGSLSVTKTGKKEYCITATVSIQKDQLRKHLEKQKIITGFSDMF